MDKTSLLESLRENHPGWQEWDQLITLAESLDLEAAHDEFIGDYLASGTRLCFADAGTVQWPDWMPAYVRAIYGMKADEPMMAGGYAESFDGVPTKRGQVFAKGSDDAELGFPVFDVPDGVFGFQSNASGALFHVDTQLNVLAPNSDKECLGVIDSLEDFTKKNIRQALAGERWSNLYEDLPGMFLD